MSAAPISNTTPPTASSLIDPAVHAALARANGSFSTASVLLALSDWTMHMAASPGKCLDLAKLGAEQTGWLIRYAAQSCIKPAEQAPADLSSPPDPHRFVGKEWQQWPFNIYKQNYLLTERWLEAATQGVWGVEKHHTDMVRFLGRQWLNMVSPDNHLLSNPVVLKRTLEQGGVNLLRGALNAMQDTTHALEKAPPPGTERYVVGKDVALTPGKVIHKNQLMELIQYSPSTAQVFADPVLIVPAWIMKYYILDLSPSNSLIKYLVGQGHTVFCISWKNPSAAERDLSLDDYLTLGVRDSLKVINAVLPKRKVHAVGYCLGGTLLTIAAAHLAREHDRRLASMTLFAAQCDFTEPGDLSLFIDESQISLLEAQMDANGYLTGEQMAAAFQLLHTQELFWSRAVDEYLLGEAPSLNDLMAWNDDTTRMPARMHSQYLRHLFLSNDLSAGRYRVDNEPVALSDLNLPVFLVGTVTDHVAPWRSVYKLHQFCTCEITFALTSGGHNAGIVSAPGLTHHHYQLLTRPAGAVHLSPDDWLAQAPQQAGSWWPAWVQWLDQRSGARVKPPAIGSTAYRAQADAPGAYVLER